jgi:two-component system chemotaxis response regulator CheY
MYRPASVPLASIANLPAGRASLRRLPQRLRDASDFCAMPTYPDSPLHSSSKRMTSQSAGILVVDDEPTVRVLVAKILTSRGYLVLPATNGAEALAVFNRARPSLAVLDMRMPVMDGWGFVRALHEQNMWLPVLVMTAAEDGERWAREIGAAGYLSKPFDYQDLLAKVSYLVPPC